jgi:hypothetical protein
MGRAKRAKIEHVSFWLGRTADAARDRRLGGLHRGDSKVGGLARRSPFGVLVSDAS